MKIKKTLAITVVMMLCCVGIFETPDISMAKTRKTISITVGKTKEISAPKSWKDVTWKVSNKRVKVVRKKKNNKIKIQGIKKGTCHVTAISGKKKKKFVVKVMKKRTQDEKKAVNVTLVSAQYASQKITATVHLENQLAHAVSYGMGADFYCKNSDGTYSKVENETVVPSVAAVLAAGENRDITFECINTKVGLTRGHYKLKFEMFSLQDESGNTDTTAILQEVEFDV